MNKCTTYLLCIVFLISCAENRSPEYSKEAEVSSPIPTTLSTEDAYTLLITEKLHDFFEKQKITIQHPDFKSQPHKNTPSLIFNDSIASITILDEIPSQAFDSLALQTVISYYNNRHHDTILAHIQRTKTIIEGKEVISSKVMFKKMKE